MFNHTKIVILMKTTTSPICRRTAGFSRFLAAAVLAGIGSLSTASANPLAALQAYLKSSNTGAGHAFGYSVAVSGDTAVVGAPFEDSSTPGVNSTPNEGAADAGAAYVFVRNGTRWSQQAYLKASNPDPGDNFGGSVAVSGDTVVIGAKHEDSSTPGVNQPANESAADSGAAYVFVRTGTVWSQEAYLKAGNPGAADRFGLFVSVSGNTVAVGAPLENSSTAGVNQPPDEAAPFSGAAYVFVRSGTVWAQQAFLKAGNSGSYDGFGTVALAGDTLIVGAPSEDTGTPGVNQPPNENALSSGAAYVFVRSGTTWTQQAFLKAGNPGEYDFFGAAVAVSGDTAVVGASSEDTGTPGVNQPPNENAVNSGAAYVFVRNGTVWTQQAFLKAGNAQQYDDFGSSVAVSGNTVVVGAPSEDGSATNMDGPPDEGTQNSGAAYVFVRNGTTWTQQNYLKASNTGETDSFGGSVAVSGDTVIAGATIEAGSRPGVNPTPDDGAEGAGAAYIYCLAPPFQLSPWTNDATSGIGAKTLWARRFGVADNATINGVTLAGTGYVVSSPAFDLAGPTENYTIDDNNNLSGLTGQGSAAVAKRFSYGGNPATLTFKQLTPGFTYTATLLTVGWEATPGIRAQTFTSGTDSRVIDQNAYGDNAGLRIDYTFKAATPTRTLTITPPNANYTLHLYAVALRLSGFTAPTDLQMGYSLGDMTFSFTGATGVSYTLWQSDDLQTWTNTGVRAINGSGSLTSFGLYAPNPVAVTKRYYRVQGQ